MENEQYAKEYNAIMKRKEQAITNAQDEVAKVNEVYSKGYSERAKNEGGFFTILQETNKKIEEENTRHNDRLNEINNSWFATEEMRRGAIRGATEAHNFEIKKIWKDLYKNMDESQAEQLGTWLAMVTQTELYGGKIDDETSTIVDSILASYDSMPKSTRDAMKNAMQPMLEEMEKKEPSLFTKASRIANGILNRLKQAFDIHSPSRETRSIFKNVMLGAELGLEDEEKRLYDKVNGISSKLLGKFGGMSTNMQLGNMSNEVIDRTRTVFTTPNIVINTNDLSKDKLDLIFNDLNRRFGSNY
jgi:hypothetical protein